MLLCSDIATPAADDFHNFGQCKLNNQVQGGTGGRVFAAYAPRLPRKHMSLYLLLSLLE